MWRMHSVLHVGKTSEGNFVYVSSAMGAGGDRIGKERWGASYEVG